MTATPATLIPLYIQRIRECVKMEDDGTRYETWESLSRHVSVLLKQSKNSQLLELVFSEEEREAFMELVKFYSPRLTASHLTAAPESSKLSEYASVAKLPPMPWAPQIQSSSTDKEPNDKRNLRSIQQISTTEFLGRVLSYKRLGLLKYHPRIYSKPYVVSHLDIDQAARSTSAWVRQVALETALCLLHETETEFHDWKFGKATSKKGLSDVVLKRPKSAQFYEKKLLVEVKCPWTLPLKDMKQILEFHNGLPNLSELEAADDGGESPSSFKASSSEKGKKIGYNAAQKVLAQVYDYGQEQKHHFFIITTYEHWMFGVFSVDYTSAAVTDPLPYDHEGPTILQCIKYWLQSCLFLPGSFEVPEVSAVPNHAGSSDLYTTRSMWRRALRTWRKASIQELRLNTQFSEHTEAKTLIEMCDTSLTELDSPPTSPTSRDAHLVTRCDDILQSVRHPPSSPLEWIMILTWLALALDPITLHHDLRSLEEAFVDATDLDQTHPIHKDQIHAKKKSSVDSRRARGESAGMLPPNHSWAEEDAVPEFYWRYASKEAATILDRYLSSSIRRRLREWHLRGIPTIEPRNLKRRLRDYHGPDARFPSQTRLPNRRAASEARSAIAVVRPTQLEPPRRKLRASVGIPAEIYISAPATSEVQPELITQSIPERQALLGIWDTRDHDHDDVDYLVVNAGMDRSRSYEPISPSGSTSYERSPSTPGSGSGRRSASLYPNDIFEKSEESSESEEDDPFPAEESQGRGECRNMPGYCDWTIAPVRLTSFTNIKGKGTRNTVDFEAQAAAAAALHAETCATTQRCNAPSRKLYRSLDTMNSHKGSPGLRRASRDDPQAPDSTS
ncbi:hypothetical protein FS837_010659 [Tulasnella sp. UAMH 9824]|nr:hypothetical protein FS837_010659 [Tulasnella sp. UAMH 9824]